jgi:hypothetical protein
LAFTDDDFPNPASGREPLRVICDPGAGRHASADRDRDVAA